MINVELKQQHIGELAKRDPSRSFTRLYRSLGDEAWLTEAWKRIRKNKGSKTAGVDGQTRDDVDESAPRTHLQSKGCGAALEMRVGPSAPAYRRRRQTASSCSG